MFRPASFPAALSILLLLCTLTGCATANVRISPAFTIAQNQLMVPIVPFTNTLVPETFSEAVFNDFVDILNENQLKSGFSWFGIVKDDMKTLEKVLSPGHIYITGEVWSYIENSGCCSTEIRVKSRLRISRVVSQELLWEAEIPIDSFFEHDSSTFPIEREKIAKRLATAMTMEILKALQGAKRISID